jgi:hypothetical protein
MPCSVWQTVNDVKLQSHEEAPELLITQNRFDVTRAHHDHDEISTHRHYSSVDCLNRYVHDNDTDIELSVVMPRCDSNRYCSSYNRLRFTHRATHDDICGINTICEMQHIMVCKNA